MESNYRNRPKYLAPLGNEKAGDDFSVLSDRETIRNLAKNICNALRHPATIWDINRLGMGFDNDLRIQSNIEYFSFRSACRLLRHCAGQEMCHECDKFHAAIVKEFSSGGIQACIDSAMENTPPFFYDGYAQRPPKVLDSFTRPVLEYHCPILGYRELLFPIYYQKMVIGVLFLGQTVILSEDVKIIDEIAGSFFNKPENRPEVIFKDFLLGNPDFCGVEPDEIKDLIIDADRFTEPMDRYLRHQWPRNGDPSEPASLTFEESSKYMSFIHLACSELDNMERKLVERVKEKRKTLFDRVSREAVDMFFRLQREPDEGVTRSDTHKQRLVELQRAWDGFHAAAERIKEQLGLVEVLLFGDGVELSVRENPIKKLYPRPTGNESRLKWKYDLSKVTDRQPTEDDFICSLESPEVLNGLHSKVGRPDAILLVYHDVAVLLRVRDLSDNSDIYTEMAITIGKSFSRIRSAVALCAANLMKEQHVLTLRMNRHESAHISTRLSDNMRRFFAQDGRTFMDLLPDKQKNVVDDMQNTIRLIFHMAGNIGIVIGSVGAETIRGMERRLDVVDLLYKWQVMFRDQLNDRNLDIIVYRGSEDKAPYYMKANDEDAPRYIETNRDLFELLLYNLVDNAVKYAYRGSVICLGWRRPRVDATHYILTVSNLGPRMEEDERLYELYARGDSADITPADGDGIGLYVVKRMEDLLDITVSHTSTYIAPFHLPLAEWYIAEQFPDSLHDRKQAELSKYMQGSHDFASEDIVNKNERTVITRRNISQEYLDSHIGRKSWLTTFTVKFPIK